MDTLLADLPTLVRLAQTGSVSRTARDLDVPRSTISRRLARLEAELGTPLAERTTRSFRLTPAGQLLVDGASRLLAELQTLRETVAASAGSVRGRLRVAAPPGLSGPFIGAFLRTFQERFPEVEVEFVVLERRPHLIDEGFDLVLATGPLDDMPWVRHRLGQSWYLAVASPAYLALAGVPGDVDALHGHRLLAARLHGRSEREWPLLLPERPSLPIHPRLVTNDLASLRGAALEGLGVALLPVHLLLDDLAQQTLVPVLPTRIGQPLDIYALFAPERRTSPLIRALLASVDAFALQQPSSRLGVPIAAPDGQEPPSY
jgi:LysR family transcriptional regulator for bpeEF and oprC